MQHPQKKQTKRMSRRLIALLTALALMAAAAFVLLLPVIRQRYPAKTVPFEPVQDTVRTVGKRDAAQLVSITLYPDGQNGYTLTMANGALVLGENGATIDETYQTDILNAVTEVNVQDTVTEHAADVSEHLEAMGFKKPQAKAVARYADGTEETYEVGHQVYDSTDYYFRWSGAEGIYTCHSGVLEAFTLEANVLIPFHQPTLYGSLLESLHIENANGACAFQFANGTSGQLSEPCAYPVTDDTAQMLMTAAQNIRLGAYEAELTAENRAAYGFDSPLCTIEAAQGEGLSSLVGEDGALQAVAMPAQTLRFVIGRAEGDYFYTCLYENDVYLISRFLVETLVNADWRKLISRTPAHMGDVSLRTIVFETPEQTAEIQIVRTESVLENNQLGTDADGNIVWNISVTVNGNPAPQEQFDLLLDRLNNFTVEGDLPASAQPDGEPRWRVTLIAETGEIRVLEGYRLDVFSDAVAVNGVMRHYVYDEAINVLMTGLL